MKILVIEDEPKVGKALAEGLKADGYEVTLAQSGEDGFFMASSLSFDLIVLDVMLPGRNGIEVLKTLRKQRLGIPVLLLTAKDAIGDRVSGLDAGADDYLVKPFAFPELRARIRALLRRGKAESLLSLKLGTLEMNLTTRSVTRDAKPIELTVTEFELLEFLLRNKGRVVSREMLARDVWKENNRATPLDNVIDVHIARLRRKVDDEFDPKLVRTVRGVGFMLSEDDR
jgi:two-component system, OmpR family, copper resistance phosphate regulon response regulator CusR